MWSWCSERLGAVCREAAQYCGSPRVPHFLSALSHSVHSSAPWRIVDIPQIEAIYSFIVVSREMRLSVASKELVTLPSSLSAFLDVGAFVNWVLRCRLSMCYMSLSKGTCCCPAPWRRRRQRVGRRPREHQGWALAWDAAEGSCKSCFVKPLGQAMCQKRIKRWVGVFRVTDGHMSL